MQSPKTIILIVICVCLIVSLFLPSALSKDQPTDSLQWGMAVNGLQMSISDADSRKTDVPEFQVVLRNVGEQDVILKLGMMLANGKVQLPENISITITDAGGRTRRFRFSDPKYGFVAGRVDDYIVPLRAGSTYTLRIGGEQLWSTEAKDYGLKLSPGKYQIAAHFEGGGATSANLDMQGVSLMNLWQGKLQSNSLAVER